jgi:hypothetical protein
MAGLFDFKSAEEILEERRAATKANQQQLLNTIVSAAPTESRQASMLGAQLGIALGRALGAKSEQEQLTKYRDMGVTIEEMQKEAGANLQNPNYGANVLRQAQEEQQISLGLLPEDMQQSEKLRVGMESTPEDLDLVGRYRYMAKVFQDAGFTARAAQAAFLADTEAQRQREFQDKLTDKREQEQKDRYSRTYIAVQNANPFDTPEELHSKTLALLEGRPPVMTPSQPDQKEVVATPLAEPPLIRGEDIGAPPRQEDSGVLDSALDIGGNLYNKAVDSVSQAMTSLDEFLSGGGRSSSAFNFDSYLQSKGINKAALTPEQLNALYMQGKEEYKKAFQDRVKDQAQNTVKNILPTK